MKIELKKIQFSERMSEETNCFVADLYIDGKKVGYCENRGTGGPTDYHGNTKEDNAIIAKAEKYCKSLPKVKVKEMNFEYDMTLEHFIDNLLDEHLKAKDMLRIQKKMQKVYMSAICYGVPNGYTYHVVSWKDRTLAQIDKINLQRAYNEIKKGLKNGEVILNTNLKELGINV